MSWASGWARTRWPPITDRCRGSAASGSSTACGPATCGRWWPPPRWSSASTSGRSSWCARSARPTASPPSSSGWAGPTTTAPVSRGGSCTRPPGTSWSNAPRCWPRSSGDASTPSTRPSSRSTSSPSRSWPRRRPGATTVWPRTSCSAWSPGPGHTGSSPGRSSRRSSIWSPPASRPGAAGAWPISIATGSTGGCAAAGAPGWPPSPRAERFPRPATTAC